MKNNSRELLLSVIVPVGDMAGKLQFLESWSPKVNQFPIEVIVIHDQTFLEVGTEIRELLRKRTIKIIKEIEKRYYYYIEIPNIILIDPYRIDIKIIDK